jgi:hypothetical protein
MEEKTQSVLPWSRQHTLLRSTQNVEDRTQADLQLVHSSRHFLKRIFPLDGPDARRYDVVHPDVVRPQPFYAFRPVQVAVFLAKI